MELKLNELTGKFKALNLIIKKVDDTVTAREKASLAQIEASISNKIDGIYRLKEEIEELKFVNKERDESVETWAAETRSKLDTAKEKISLISQTLLDIENEESSTKQAKDEEARRKLIYAETEKQIEIEKARIELERAHKVKERKRELEHQDMILQQQIKFEKTKESYAEKSNDRLVRNVKLPKLSITKFSGKYLDWLSFCNTFEVEIDSTELSPVSKFGYLKELLEPNVRSEIEGLPFSTEGYERAKNLLKSEYGKTSERLAEN